MELIGNWISIYSLEVRNSSMVESSVDVVDFGKILLYTYCVKLDGDSQLLQATSL